jgi:hypothetical protein
MPTKKYTKNGKRNLAKKKAALERIKARQAEVSKKKKHFMESTIDAQSSFLVEDVIGDGACMYRALANCIYYGLPLLYDDLTDLKKRDKKRLLYKSLANMRVERQHNDVEKRDDEEWGWNGDSQDIVARKLQKISLMYITEHQNEPMDGDDSKLAIREVIEAVHELDFDEYLYYYQFFAGDDIEAENESDEEKNQFEDTDEKDESDTEEHENKEENTTEIEGEDDDDESVDFIMERWGGFPEQYAISKIFDRPIYVYSAEKWNTRTNKINVGTIRNNKFVKNVRLRLYHVVNSDASGMPLYLLWSKSKRHYYAMMLNEIN